MKKQIDPLENQTSASAANQAAPMPPADPHPIPPPNQTPEKRKAKATALKKGESDR
jgi:hypothetical protein